MSNVITPIRDDYDPNEAINLKLKVGKTRDHKAIFTVLFYGGSVMILKFTKQEQENARKFVECKHRSCRGSCRYYVAVSGYRATKLGLTGEFTIDRGIPSELCIELVKQKKCPLHII